ncbi:MAG: beta-ketoacyl-[acyl-carrier-protein] synthase family protein [Candidatus Hydrogenedentes bacterium]|nr:beta-ketoacyl-[acyl-carrier-protein] synthase family protein [Candidatus Hydrogenedentota bacterium]
MHPRTVVITGFGILACNGLGRKAFWNSLREGKSGIRRIERFDPAPFPCQIAGELWGFDAHDYLKKADVKRWHRYVHQAVASAKLAAEDALLAEAGYEPERIAVGFGTSAGAPDEYYMKYRDSFENGGWSKIDKLASSTSSGHAATANVSAVLQARGPATTLASGCATGLDIISWGAMQIQRGLADAAICGASEAPLTELTLAATCSLGILSKRNDEPAKAMRPFDRDSDGIVLSEGAGAVILESAEHAEARGAPILAEVAGYGAAAEGNNPLILDKDGRALARAIRAAIQAAGTSAEEIEGAACHGVSLPAYDRSETNAFKDALGKHAYRIPITACKSMTGQPYSAGGIFNVGTALFTLTTGIVPPTINLDEPDPVCDLDFVPKHARYNDVRAMLVTAMSFGGTHGALIMRKRN